MGCPFCIRQPRYELSERYIDWAFRASVHRLQTVVPCRNEFACSAGKLGCGRFNVGGPGEHSCASLAVLAGRVQVVAGSPSGRAACFGRALGLLRRENKQVLLSPRNVGGAANRGAPLVCLGNRVPGRGGLHAWATTRKPPDTEVAHISSEQARTSTVSTSHRQTAAPSSACASAWTRDRQHLWPGA